MFMYEAERCTEEHSLALRRTSDETSMQIWIHISRSIPAAVIILWIICHCPVLRYTSLLSKYQDTDHTLHGTENIPLIQSTIDPHPHSSSPESSNRNLFTILISAPRPRKIPISSPLKFSPVLPVFTIQGGIWNPSSKFDTLYLVATPSRTLSLMRPYVQCLGQKWTTDRRGLLLMTPRVDEWRRTSNACNKSQFIWLETTFDRFMISSMPLINILLMKINPRISF